MRRLRDIAAMLAVAATLTACTAGRSAPSTGAVPPPSPCPSDRTCHAVVGTDPAIVVYRGPFYSNLMPLTGRLRWVESESCLVVQREDNPTNRFRTFFPVWPEGTRPVRAPDGRRGVEVPGAGQILEGVLFQAGGSDFPAGLTPPIPSVPTFDRPPGACSAHDGFFVMSSWGTSRLQRAGGPPASALPWWHGGDPAGAGATRRRG
ncbi:hypothetical protein [Nonomuraea zeae]|uniref:Uncharacterized protein n=1 Tax=Nonomuraea zeae TaxID=1642303 RepID=A0A5S4GUU5_9ACTN|nr:hypothetical protein [Nonomuraea zeae]TMR36234.1 hypothetical protein ETD85_11550 [Nonomuraea zeae]